MKHYFSSAKSNGSDGTIIQPSYWNDTHVHGLNPVSTTTTLDATYDLVLCTAGAGGITINLPAATTRSGLTYIIKKVDSAAGSVTVTPNGSDTVEGQTSYALTTQYQYAKFVADGTSNWVIVANN